MYAQDFLNASHSSSSNRNAIKISFLEMSKKELQDRVEDEEGDGLFGTGVSFPSSIRLGGTTAAADKDKHHQDEAAAAGVGIDDDIGDDGDDDDDDNDNNDNDDHKEKQEIIEDGDAHRSAEADAEAADAKDVRRYCGIYLDDLVWRLVGKLVGKLVATNSVNLFTIAMSATANNTVSAAASAMKSVSQTALGSAAAAGRGVKSLLWRSGSQKVMLTSKCHHHAHHHVHRVHHHHHHHLNVFRTSKQEQLSSQQPLVRKHHRLRKHRRHSAITNSYVNCVGDGDGHGDRALHRNQ